MAKVRQPGSRVERVLDCDLEKAVEEQTVLVLKVLDYDEWRQLRKAVDRLNPLSHPEEIDETARKVLGIGLLEVRNLKVLNQGGAEEDFVLKRAGNEITKESMAILMPWRDEILVAIKKASTFDGTDLKNSP